MNDRDLTDDVRIAERCWTESRRSATGTGDDGDHTIDASDDEDGLVTDALHFPLLFSRDGLDPIAELANGGPAEPVSKLELPFGITAWLVTGYDAAKEVLGDATSFSNAFGNLRRTDDEQDPGGLGMTDPPYHTRLRKMLTPEFTMRRLPGCGRGSRPSSTGSWMPSRRPASRRDLVDLFAHADPVAGDLRAAGRALRGPGRASRRSDGAVRPGRRLAAGRHRHVAGLPAGPGGAQRAEPGDGLLGMLIREHGDEHQRPRAGRAGRRLLTGGHETTAQFARRWGRSR